MLIVTIDDRYHARSRLVDYAEGVTMDLWLRAAVYGSAYFKREIPMPARQLQEELIALRDYLDQNPTLTLEERERVQELAAQIQSEIELGDATRETPNMVDSFKVAAETFEQDHPAVAGILRSISTTLQGIGV